MDEKTLEMLNMLEEGLTGFMDTVENYVGKQMRGEVISGQETAVLIAAVAANQAKLDTYHAWRDR